MKYLTEHTRKLRLGKAGFFSNRAGALGWFYTGQYQRPSLVDSAALRV